MSNQEILTKALEKAMAKCWVPNNPSLGLVDWSVLKPEDSYCVIYSHDFAKALWGEVPFWAYQWHKTIQRADDDLVESGGKTSWQYHLQQMVIAEDPIKYLGENI